MIAVSIDTCRLEDDIERMLDEEMQERMRLWIAADLRRRLWADFVHGNTIESQEADGDQMSLDA